MRPYFSRQLYKVLIMRKLWAIISLALLIQSCGSSTSVTASYLNPKVKPQPREKVFVIALTDRTPVRQSLESAMASEARKRGLEAVESLEVFPVQFTENKVPSKEALKEVIEKSGADILITFALIDERHDTRYVQGSGSYAPSAYGFYGGYYPYYSARASYMYQPGYYTEDKRYFFETNLYDINTEELIWSAQSTSVNPSGLDKFTKEHTAAIISRMKKDGLIQE